MTGRAARGALVSIHDVMPSTLDAVQELLDLSARHGVDRLTLLVVPGLDWSADQLDRLRRWQAEGHALAGHGWAHRPKHIRGWKHRLHSLFISRDCAEHLALEGTEIAALMIACRDWFERHALGAPALYVPPAWALGPISRAALRETGFTRVETTGGLIDVATGRFRFVPLVGFEARDAWQVPVLAVNNWFNRLVAGRGWLRVAIHPDDHRLPLAGGLERALAAVSRARLYDEFGRPGEAA
ncbi:MAG: polysaccharide deacetylase family protein [Pseudomonadota bacterium]